ncbi:hypothetical protein LCGC14_1884700 [marine sediment metagenome]|uniref:Capsid protein n=1 Tax=marine sediment metagenome TaxID=412755 RepID=A0A0F9G176_9ZZZZ
MADTGSVTVTTAGVFLGEFWKEAILNYAERSFRLRNQVTDLSSELASGGKTVNIPRVTEETATSKTAGQNVVYTTNTDGDTTLTVDQHFYTAKVIEDVVKVQDSSGLFNMYTKAMGYAMAKKIENFIALLIQSSTANDTALSADNTMTAALLRSGIAKLYALGVDTTMPGADVWLYGSPKTYLSILGLDQFVSWEKIGPSDVSGNKTGIVGEVYGIPTLQSTDWDEDGGTGDETASIFTKESIFYAQQLLRVQSDYSIDALGTKVVADALFGGVLTQTAAATASQIVNFTNP